MTCVRGVNNTCNHCGNAFVWRYVTSLCPNCFLAGHRFEDCGTHCHPRESKPNVKTAEAVATSAQIHRDSNSPVSLTIPLQTVSEMNSRDHWTVRLERKQAQQGEVLVELHNALKGRRIQMPCTVTLTRLGPSKLDGDNLQASLKFCRDTVAWKLGVDDAEGKGITWKYEQETQKEYGVKVEICSLAEQEATA